MTISIFGIFINKLKKPELYIFSLAELYELWLLVHVVALLELLQLPSQGGCPTPRSLQQGGKLGLNKKIIVFLVLKKYSNS